MMIPDGPYLLFSPENLIPTEDVDQAHVVALEREIRRARRWIAPIVVHNTAFFVMDGHHRLAAAKRLRLNRLPVILLNYDNVDVMAWRDTDTVTSEAISAMARARKTFPVKTTRHIFHNPLPRCDIPLDLLRANPTVATTTRRQRATEPLSAAAP